MSKVQANAVGTKIGQYTIIKHLASTRNSHVFLVNDEQLQKPLVLKLFAAEQNGQNLPDQSSTRQSNQHFTSKNTQYLQAEKEQFLLQAKLLFEFDSHQSIVKVMHVGQYACEDAPDIVLPYIVMPCYTQSLDQLLALHQQKLSFSTSFKIIQGLLSALIALHAKDVLHLDIKPQNVFLDEQNLPYLGDFGNALVMTASPLVSKLSSHLPSVDGTSTNTSIGVSASYASPELIAHWTESQQYQPSSDASESKGINSATNTTENITIPLSHQSDLYALGALWFRMLTGHSAYQHIENLATLSASDINLTITNILSDLAPEWAILLIAQLLQNKKEQRPTSAEYCLDYCVQHHQLAEADHTILADKAVLSTKLQALVKQIETCLLTKGFVDSDTFERFLHGLDLSGAQAQQPASQNRLALQDLINRTQENLANAQQLHDWFAWIQYLQVMLNNNKTSLNTQRYQELLQVGRAARPDAAALCEQILNERFQVNSKANSVFRTYLIPSLIVLVLVVYYVFEQTGRDIDSSANNQVINEESNEESNEASKDESDEENYRHLDTDTQAEKVLGLAQQNVPLVEPAAVNAKITSPDKTQGFYTISPVRNSNNNSKLRIHWVISSALPEVKIFASEVSNQLYSMCEEEGACRRVKQYSTQKKTDPLHHPLHPKVNVSWYDINQQFIPWLNQRVNKRFSLPSFAQWQLIVNSQQAASSVNNLPNIQTSMASQKYTIHCQDCRHSLAQRFANGTMPTAQGIPDINKMFHVLGNAQEWLADCWREQRYIGNAVAPSSTVSNAIKKDDQDHATIERCDQAPVVGLSWLDKRMDIASSLVSQRAKSAQMPNTGFRLVEYIND